MRVFLQLGEHMVYARIAFPSVLPFSFVYDEVVQLYTCLHQATNGLPKVTIVIESFLTRKSIQFSWLNLPLTVLYSKYLT